jgi:hypothetical protein
MRSSQIDGLLGKITGTVYGGQVKLSSTGVCSGLAAGLFGQQAPQRDGLPGHQLYRALGGVWLDAVAQGLQQAGLQLGEEREFFSVVFGASDLAAKGKPFLCPGFQAFVGGGTKVLVTGVFGFGGFPHVELGFDIAFENFGQLVVAVKLVFVGNASEGLDCVE